MTRPETPFAAPWEAQVFALAVALNDKGLFAWREFSAELGAELKAAGDAPGDDASGAYYRAWLAALERLLARKGLLSSVVIAAREAAVRRDAEARPHGV